LVLAAEDGVKAAAAVAVGRDDIDATRRERTTATAAEASSQRRLPPRDVAFCWHIRRRRKKEDLNAPSEEEEDDAVTTRGPAAGDVGEEEEEEQQVERFMVADTCEVLVWIVVSRLSGVGNFRSKVWVVFGRFMAQECCGDWHQRPSASSLMFCCSEEKNKLKF